ncbi:family 43 glycosylhydrolase [Agromyces aurantiacus]|uniref:beta-fructofuranosidase n=1 Tax=Agromyces aurantiacus TaxID=165814 RepID=A0ABV9R4F2_9MICO|nr:glycoside hydrolase family 32 protein [Agromyces aurantiacus]MBM7503529.1 beta-fructofuranosidase [Agromyces aurantiacus]
MTEPVFFRPTDAWVGDVIPWQEDGVFHLFYLHEVRRTPKPGTPWNLITTTDLVRFDDRGVALAAGDDDASDFNAYTGSIVRDADGVHHLFYTGQNPRRLGDDGLPLQLVMHATSVDGMATWQRHPEHTFGASIRYETADWRDPFVFRDEEAGLWRMLIAARHVGGPERRRGVIAQCVSHDLASWQPVEPFWDPRRYITHECPEVFQWGDWWYLVYSEFSESFTTRYRMARSLHGPWRVPEHDSLDGRAYYAAKSAERDGRRFFFGWIASRDGARDDGPWLWAGTLSVLEARQNPDGTLAFGFPAELTASFTEMQSIGFDEADEDELPPAAIGGTPIELRAHDGYRAVVSREELPSAFHAAVTFDIAAGTTECGVLLRSSADGDEGYVIRLEPKRHRMVFDRWPRPRTGDGQWEVSGDVPYVIELERPCHLPPGEHTLEVVVDGDLCVAVLDGRVTLSTRLYDRPAGRLGLFVGEGAAVVTGCRIGTRPDAESAPDETGAAALVAASATT